jgi:polyhydroxyalkanoate synthesis repressor PhaR
VAIMLHPKNISLQCSILRGNDGSGKNQGLIIMAEDADKKSDDKKDVVTIKKYANRRLYNTATSSYVTLDHLSQMVKDGTDFVVYDAKSGDDITRSVLTHIIVEEEGKGQHLLPISFLRHLISFYGDSLQAVVPNYLEHSMEAFAHNQEQMRRAVHDAFGGLTPFGQFEEMGKQNMTMFENAMKMFQPFYPGGGGAPGSGTGQEQSPQAGAGAGAAQPEGGSELDALKTQLAQMQNQLERMSGDGK